jgi:hypothetical protein
MIKALFIAILSHGKDFSLHTIENIRHNDGILRAARMKEMPSASTLSKYIRRLCGTEKRRENDTTVSYGVPDGTTRVQNTYYELTEQLFKMCAQHSSVLDYDASICYAEKKHCKKTYEGEYGCMAYIGFVGPLCTSVELEPGNHSPNDHVYERTRSLIEYCKAAGINVTTMRADAASYHHQLLDYCHDNDIIFYVRAPNNAAVKEDVQAIKKWEPEILHKTKEKTETIYTGETVHAMNKSQHAFRIVGEKRVTEKPPETDGRLLDVVQTITEHWMIATNDNTHTPAEIIETYNARQHVSEHGNEVLKNEYGLRHLPFRCEDGLEANRIYAYLCGMLCNLCETFKQTCIPKEEQPKRLSTLIHKYMYVPARIKHHAHTTTVALPSYAKKIYRVLNMWMMNIKNHVKRIPYRKEAPHYVPLIYRRI